MIVHSNNSGPRFNPALRGFFMFAVIAPELFDDRHNSTHSALENHPFDSNHMLKHQPLVAREERFPCRRRCSTRRMQDNTLQYPAVGFTQPGCRRVSNSDISHAASPRHHQDWRYSLASIPCPGVSWFCSASQYNHGFHQTVC